MASVQRRGNGSFLLVVEAGYDAKGKRIRRTKTIRVQDKALLKTTKKLRDYLNDELVKFKMEVEAGAYIAPEKMKIESFIDDWHRKFALKYLSEKTRYEQMRLIKNHVLPHIGHLRLDQVKPIHIINYLDKLANEDSRIDGRPGCLSDATIYQVDKVLRSIFNRAKEWHVLKESPMETIKRPKVKRKEMNYLDQEEAARLIVALQEFKPTWRLYFLTAMIGGLRRGEIIALEWTDLDFENDLIHVKKSIPMFEDKQPVIKDTKTGTTRFVSMPSWYMEEMRKFQEEWQKERESVDDLWEDEERQFIFHNGVGRPLYPSAATGKWIQFRDKYGFDNIRLHDLRHTMVTLLIEEGVNIKAIQERAGHSSSKVTTDVYGHITKRVRDATAEKFEKFNPSNSSTIGQQANN
jgi:integrase